MSLRPVHSPIDPGLAECDVAVVGAGPAGAAAALELSNAGRRVVIVEQAVPPRHKTCGGGVLARAVKLLPIDVRAAVESECRVAQLVHHSPALTFTCRRERPIISMVMRDRFDHLLVTAATSRGAVLRAGARVEDVRSDADAVRVVTAQGEIRARFLIAADGVRSVVARRTQRADLRDVFPALEAEATYDRSIQERYADIGRFDFGLVKAGYGWVFPKRDHLSIGVGTTLRGAANLPQAYLQYLRALGLGAPRTEQRRGYMIPCRPRAGMFGVPRVLFVGDAAGLADPVTAEGITAAILSGQLAARAILAGSSDPASVTRRYRATLHDALLADLRVARWLAWLLYERPRWTAALLARHGDGMSELMTRIVTGETTYRQAISRPAHYFRLLTHRRHQSATN